jgi:hypothetical protein
VKTWNQRSLAYIETALAALAGLLAVITIFWRDWIEGLTGWDPDHHNGSFEIFIILGLAAVSVLLGLAARMTWRKIAPTATA